LGKAKKIGIGIGITVVAVFVILFVIANMESSAMSQKSQVLDEMYIECNEKYPNQRKEFRDCSDEADEKLREMFRDSPCLFLCPPKN